MPSGWTNDCEKKVYSSIPQDLVNREQYREEDGSTYYLTTKPEVIHAEANAIAKLAKSNESGDGSMMFLTHAPCIDCAKQVYTAGIKKVFYRNSYRDNLGIDFLEQCGVEVEKISPGEIQ
jgi:deoxycytidylate deaminase